ncbi:hypothetical protein [Sigmofec virus UA08Rod_4331]|uniref:Uncharacterized protein n=1 Tax=Sigmofec virus UA08Rod_4331 TaxID=2929399 RepID=A0A976N1E7_9VIRU|nr:hypothetical protein [Sigmofec virus UA08Rod_4331]
MLPQYYKYTQEQLDSHNYKRYSFVIDTEPYVDTDKFASIINLIYDNAKHGSLCTDINNLITEDTPVEVRNFVNNYLLNGIKTGSFDTSQLDDDYIFNHIIPRRCDLQESINFIVNNFSHD